MRAMGTRLRITAKSHDSSSKVSRLPFLLGGYSDKPLSCIYHSSFFTLEVTTFTPLKEFAAARHAQPTGNGYSPIPPSLSQRSSHMRSGSIRPPERKWKSLTLFSRRTAYSAIVLTNLSDMDLGLVH